MRSFCTSTPPVMGRHSDTNLGTSAEVPFSISESTLLRAAVLLFKATNLVPTLISLAKWVSVRIESPLEDEISGETHSWLHFQFT